MSAILVCTGVVWRGVDVQAQTATCVPTVLDQPTVDAHVASGQPLAAGCYTAGLIAINPSSTGSTLTIASGTTIGFACPFCAFSVAKGAALVADASAPGAAPITFTSATKLNGGTPAPGDWGTFGVQPGGSATFKNVVVEYAGGNAAGTALDILTDPVAAPIVAGSPPVTMRNVIIRNTAIPQRGNHGAILAEAAIPQNLVPSTDIVLDADGLVLDNNGGNGLHLRAGCANVVNATITNNGKGVAGSGDAGYGVMIGSDEAAMIECDPGLSGLTYTGNGNGNRIFLNGGTLTPSTSPHARTSLRSLGLTPSAVYEFAGALQIGSGATLTIEPTVTLAGCGVVRCGASFPVFSQIVVLPGGTLIADASAGGVIRFTSLAGVDPGIAAVAPPAPAQWGGIDLQQGSHTTLKNVTIEFAGGVSSPNPGAIQIDPTGGQAAATLAADFVTLRLDGANGLSVLDTTATAISITNSNFENGPTWAGILDNSGAGTVNACGSYWNNPNGPSINGTQAGDLITGFFPGSVSYTTPACATAFSPTLHTNPAPPTLVPASDTGVSTTDNVTYDNKPSVQGDVQANVSVQLLVDNQAVATTQSNAQGHYVFPALATALADGRHAFTVRLPVAGAATQPPPSDPLSVLVDTTPPTSPSQLSLQITLGSSQVGLGWFASTDTGGSGVDHYEVSGIDGIGGVPSLLGSVPALPASPTYGFTDPSRPLTRTSYSVVAVDVAGNVSAPATATVGQLDGVQTVTIPAAQVESFLSAFATSQQKAAKLPLVADPIDAVFGNMVYHHTDLDTRQLGPAVRIERTYNSAVLHDGPLGFGWNLSYDLRVTAPDASTVLLKRGDGRTDPYQVAADGSLTPPTGSLDALVRHADGTYTLTTGSHLVHQFTAAGRLQSVTDASGNTITLSYTGDKWTGIADAAGRAWTLTYDAAGRLHSVTDSTGRAVQYGYSPAGDLTSVTDPTGAITHFEYDAGHHLTRVTDPDGRGTAQTYDGQGRVVQQTDGRGTHTLAYAAGSTTWTDPTGATTSVTYDSNSRVTARTDALGHTRSYTYDAHGWLVKETDANGGITAYTYDSRANVTSVTDPLGHTTSLTYDGQDNLLTQTDPLGHTTTYTYDAQQHLLTETDALGNVTSFAYGPHGLLTSITDPLGHVTHLAYDAAGNLASITDPAGAATTLTSDAAGRVTAQADALGHTTHYTYDARNQVVSVTAPDGGVTAATYDFAGNRLSVTDPRNNTTSFAYSAANDLVKITDPLGAATSFAYDAMGRPVSETLADGSIWHAGYDANGQSTSTTSPLGNTSAVAYDAAGNVVSATDPSGASTSFAYDAANRLTKVTDAAGGVTNYGYDAGGNLVTLTDAAGHTTTYAYDALNRLIQTTDPLARTHTLAYDGLGRMTKTVDGAGQALNYSYDPMGRLTAAQAAATASAAAVQVSYAYDAVGNRIGMTDASGHTTYTYDPANRVLSITSPEGAVSYTYDLAGNRTGLTQPGATVAYSYDGRGSLSAVQLAGKPLVTYAYDAVGRNTKQTFANGLTTALSYDADGRLTGLVTSGPKGTVESIAYTLDKLGNHTAETSTDVNATYTYDALSRLTAASLTLPGKPTPPLSLAYTYDAAGNKLTETAAGVTATFSYDAANQLTSVANPTLGAQTISYDAAGRLTSDGLSSYRYDALNRLLGVTSPKLATTYTYDGDGNRVGEQVNGQARKFLLDTAVPFAERIAATDPQVTQQFVYGLQRAAQVKGKAIQFEHEDALGSVRLLTDATGAPLTRSTYTPYGVRLGGSGAFGFTGEPQSDETGLVHLRARDYSPLLGRFLTQDPVPGSGLVPETLNRYPYVGDNPVNLADPSGGCVSFFAGACQFVGGVVNGAVTGAQNVFNGAVQLGRSAVNSLVGGVQNTASTVTRTLSRVPLVQPLFAASSVSVQLPPGVSAASGGSLTVTQGKVIAAGGGNVIAAGAGNVIAAGAGNVIAAGGGNIYVQVAGQVIAAGGGNLIAAGGGNLIAAGGGNLRSLQLAGRLDTTLSGNLIAAGGGNLIAAGGGNAQSVANNTALLKNNPIQQAVIDPSAALAAGSQANALIAAGGGN